ISPHSEHIESVTTLTKTLAELGVQVISESPTQSATALVANTNIASGTVTTELRQVRPVGRMRPDLGQGSVATFMVSELGGREAINSGMTTHETMTLPHGLYRGPITFGVAG